MEMRMDPIVASYEHEPIRGLLRIAFLEYRTPTFVLFRGMAFRTNGDRAKVSNAGWGRGEGKVVYFDSAECASCKYFILAAWGKWD